MYDYREQIKEDVKKVVVEWCDANMDIREALADRETLEQEMNDALWIDDSVTGNVSGSYFYNSYKAKECVIDNFDLLHDMAREFGEVEEVGNRIMNEEWELLDVSIRCYLLGECISEALDELESEVA